MKSSIRKVDGPRDYVAVPNKLMSDVPNLNGDWLNFYLLILLYIIQGFPIGLSGAFPIILQSKKLVTYEEQALFSITLWPYSLKLFWAPVVDSLYIQWIGRRKSWLLPLQLFMGLLFLYMASNIDAWLPDTGQPNLKMLIIVVFVINFLSATQDIVVDGWALTMLKRKNVSYASTCNAVGVPIGMFIGSVCFTLLMSEKFWNTYLRTVPSAEGLVTMKTFLYFAGIVTLSITTVFALFKKEKDNRVEDGYVKISVLRSYKLLWDILKMPRIRILAAILLSARFGFASVESISNLKLIDAGLSKDDIMIITVASYVIKITMPIFISKYTTNSKPMSYYLKLTPFRLLWAIAYVLLIHYTPSLINKNGVKDVTVYYFVLLGSICIINEMMNFFMMLVLFAFFCRLSDPRYGGTYMTLFNTFYYLGFLVSHTIVLKLVDILTFSHCSTNAQNRCSTADSLNLCKSNKGQCEIDVDGYYLVIGICMVTGFVWYSIFKNIIKEYQSLSLSHWMINFNDVSDSKEPSDIILS